MKKILILLGIVVLVLFGLFLHWGSPWIPSHTANYFLSATYKNGFEPFGIPKGINVMVAGRLVSTDHDYLLNGDSRAIAAAVEKARDEVAACLKQDGADIAVSTTGGIGGSYWFSYNYSTFGGRHGYCSIREIPASVKAFASSPATQLIVIFYER